MSADYIEQAVQTLSNQYHGELVTMQHFEDALVTAIQALEALDVIKKALFYGKKNEFIEFEEASALFKSTSAPDFSFDRTNGETTIHGIVGVATEAGEMLSALYDSIANGLPMDQVNLREEVGDVFWYLAILARFNKFTFEEVQNKNIEKLRARYPQKFTSYDAINRNLTNERSVLEQGGTAFK